ncbi:MAG: hypothetical protein L3K26_12345 [Candidatus Hydrogenedentes bacterium]|nr:hypothetical protein [Candidatus Hydrogenedentota bacterium]
MTKPGLMKLRLPWKRCLIPLVGVGALTALAVQYTPTYGVLEHEFTVIFSLISAVMFYGLSGTVYRGVRKAMERGVDWHPAKTALSQSPPGQARAPQRAPSPTASCSPTGNRHQADVGVTRVRPWLPRFRA